LIDRSFVQSIPILCLEVGWNIFGFGEYPEEVSITLKAPMDYGSVTEKK